MNHRDGRRYPRLRACRRAALEISNKHLTVKLGCSLTDRSMPSSKRKIFLPLNWLGENPCLQYVFGLAPLPAPRLNTAATTTTTSIIYLSIIIAGRALALLKANRRYKSVAVCLFRLDGDAVGACRDNCEGHVEEQPVLHHTHGLQHLYMENNTKTRRGPPIRGRVQGRRVFLKYGIGGWGMEDGRLELKATFGLQVGFSQNGVRSANIF